MPCLLLVALFAGVTAASGTTKCTPLSRRFIAGADVSISSSDPEKPADGSWEHLLVGRSPTAQHQIYMQFDLSQLPQTPEAEGLVSVTLHLPLVSSHRSDGTAFHNSVNLERVENGWTENSLSWHNQPKLSTGAQPKFKALVRGQVVLADITSWLSGILASGGSLGVLSLRLGVSKAHDNLWMFGSREHSGGGPAVEVVQTCVPSKITSIRMQGAVFDKITPQADSYVRHGEDHERENYGTESVLLIRESDPDDDTSKLSSFVRFSLPATLKNPNAIMYAEIKLTKLRPTSADELDNIKVRLLYEDWQEGTLNAVNKPRSAFQVMFCKVRHQYNPEAETFVADATEEVKEMVDKGTGVISFEIYKETSAEGKPDKKDLPIGFMSRESGAPPLLQIQRMA